MYSINDIKINYAFQDEMRISKKLIDYGLNELKEEKYDNISYFLPLFLLSNGLERLMKCLICLYQYTKNSCFPVLNDIKTHDLKKLLNDKIICNFNTKVPYTNDDLEFIKKDRYLVKILEILSKFGEKERYINLNFIINYEVNNLNIISDYQKLNEDLLNEDNMLKYIFFENLNDYSKSIENDINIVLKERIIFTIKRFIASIVRQFTLGDLVDDSKRYIFPFNDYLLFK